MTYHRYNILSTGDRTYKVKSFYHCVTPDHSSCSAGVVISFYKFKCSVVDISGYRDHCQYSRYIYNIYFIKTSVK